MEIRMSVVKYSAIEKCIDLGIVPFAICLSKDDARDARVDEFIDKYYGITVDNRGYGCCVCNVILADKCRSMDYTSFRMKDKSVKKIKEFKPVKNEQLQGKVIVDVVFEDGTKLNSIALVESAIEDIERGKVIINEE